MATVESFTTFQRADGIIESEAVVTATDGESITSGELGLGTISRVKSVQPLEDRYVASGAEITNAGALNNSVTLHLYYVSNSDTLVTFTNFVKWFINAQQV